jgi:hypothetical protein
MEINRHKTILPTYTSQNMILRSTFGNPHIIGMIFEDTFRTTMVVFNKTYGGLFLTVNWSIIPLAGWFLFKSTNQNTYIYMMYNIYICIWYVWIYDDIRRIFSQKVWESQATNRSAPFVRGFQHLHISLSDRWLLPSLEGDGDDRVVPSTRGGRNEGKYKVKWPINPWLWDEVTRVKMHGPQMSTVLASTFGELIFTQPQVDCPLIAWGCITSNPTRWIQRRISNHETDTNIRSCKGIWTGCSNLFNIQSRFCKPSPSGCPFEASSRSLPTKPSFWIMSDNSYIHIT